MPKAQVEVSPKTEVAQNPLQSSAPLYISSLSLLVALFAFGVAFATYCRGARIEKQTRFHRAFGSELRDKLRDLEKELAGLTAFIVPSQRPLRKLRDELEVVRTEIEEKSFDVSLILSEISQSRLDKTADWSSKFNEQMRASEALLQSTSHATVNTFQKFSDKCREARTNYEVGIKGVRSLLDRYEGTV